MSSVMCPEYRYVHRVEESGSCLCLPQLRLRSEAGACFQSLRQDDLAGGEFWPCPEQAECVPERAARPCRVGRDFHDQGFHQRQGDGFLVPVEPVQSRALHGGGPRMRAAGWLEPVCQLQGVGRPQWGGAADHPELAVEDQARHNFRGPGQRSDDRSADVLYPGSCCCSRSGSTKLAGSSRPQSYKGVAGTRLPGRHQEDFDVELRF